MVSTPFLGAFMKGSNNLRAAKNSNGVPHTHRHVNGNVPGRIVRPRLRPLIAVYGSSAARRGDEVYAAGLAMGRLLGESGFDVMTGGYKGVMEAVSRGARAGKAHVVGITMARFEDRVNRYVMDEIHTANFYERFGWLVDRADGYVAMPGGIGTLAEVSFAWQELLLEIVPPRPLVLVGTRWRALYDSFIGNLVPTPNLYDVLTLAATPAEAVEFLCAHFAIERGASATP
jgi:uncharacterized protein (TIGR00730 family)